METSTLEIREIVGRMKLSPRGGAGLLKKCVDAILERSFLGIHGVDAMVPRVEC